MAAVIESYIGRHRPDRHGTTRGVLIKDESSISPIMPLPLALHAERLHGSLTPAQAKTLDRINGTDWSGHYLNIRKESHQKKIAEGVALGSPLAVNFGNIYGIFGRADRETMIRINLGKGREPLQVASVVTTPEHIHEIFDYSKFQGVKEEEIKRMMERFYDRSPKNPLAQYAGPIGFRGPASEKILDHLTTTDAQSGIKTVQLIAPGYNCPSNVVFGRAIDMIENPEQPYLMATSANESSNRYVKKNGVKVKIPSHHTRIGMQEDIKNGTYPMEMVVAGLPEDEERKLRHSYTRHEPKSTTILDFTNAYSDSDGKTHVALSRGGSLSNADTRLIVESLGMVLDIPGDVNTVSDVRVYPEKRNGTAVPRTGTIFTQK